MAVKAQKPQPLKGSTVWYEVQQIIKSKVDSLPDGTAFYDLSTGELAALLQQHFQEKYDIQEVLNLLRNGFEINPGHYRFKVQDFKNIKEPVTYHRTL